MVVKIRLARFGKRNAPFYNIVVAKDRSARNSKPIEVLGESFPPTIRGSKLLEDIWRDSLTTIRGGHITGTYDPIPKPPPLGVGKPFKDIQLDTARAKYWLGVGAQPSDPAWRLLSMIGLLEPKHHVANMRQAAKNLNGPVEPATSEKSAVVRGK